LLADQRRKLGDANRATLQSLSLLSHVYTAQRKYAEASSLLNRMLQDERGKLGRDHSATLTTVNLLGDLYLAQNRFKAAEDLLLPLVSTARVTKLLTGGRHGFEEYRTTRESMRILSEVYSKSGNVTKQQALQETVAKVNQVAYGGITNKPEGADVTTQL